LRTGGFSCSLSVLPESLGINILVFDQKIKFFFQLQL
jgi:hypothetical protein